MGNKSAREKRQAYMLLAEDNGRRVNERQTRSQICGRRAKTLKTAGRNVGESPQTKEDDARASEGLLLICGLLYDATSQVELWAQADLSLAGHVWTLSSVVLLPSLPEQGNTKTICRNTGPLSAG